MGDMRTRRRDRVEHPLTELAKLPWWVSVVLAAIAYIGLRFVLPAIASGKGAVLIGISKGLSPHAGFVASGFIVVSIVSAFWGLKRRWLVDAQASLHSLNAMTWKEFEIMVSEVFRQQGYHVDYRFAKGPDGGVDLVLQKGGRISLVQCKQWRRRSIGVITVREQFGILCSEGVDESIIVTSGTFTSEARDFAKGKPIRLLDGSELLELIQAVKERKTEGVVKPLAETQMKVSNGLHVSHVPFPEEASESIGPVCPRCAAPMVLRIAKKSSRAGQEFWGCSTFPVCRGTRSGWNVEENSR